MASTLHEPITVVWGQSHQQGPGGMGSKDSDRVSSFLMAHKRPFSALNVLSKNKIHVQRNTESVQCLDL